MKTVARLLFTTILVLLLPGTSPAETGSELAARLSAAQRGASFVRLLLSVHDSSKTEKVSLQVQIKERTTETSHDVLYQILFPKDRQGESVLLKASEGKAPSGHRFVLPDQTASLGASDLDQSLFDSDLAYRDIIENFFAWKSQEIVGNEKLMGADCQILESKPDNGQQSTYGSVRSWIDPDRLLPLRVEKYDKDGKLVRRIDTTKSHRIKAGHYIPKTLKVSRPDSSTTTELDGSNHREIVDYDDTVFTVNKMPDMTPPPKN